MWHGRTNPFLGPLSLVGEFVRDFYQCFPSRREIAIFTGTNPHLLHTCGSWGL